MKAQESFETAIKNNNIVKVNDLLNNPDVDPSLYDNFAFCIACKKGHTRIVKLLLNDERVNPADDDNYSISIAYMKGHKDIVDLLLEIEEVKKTLKINRPKLYNQIIQQRLKENLEKF